MNFNDIHITISIAALIAILTLFFKAVSWFKGIDDILESHGKSLNQLKVSHGKLRKYNFRLRKSQIKIIQDLNNKHQDNVHEIKEIKDDLDRLEDKVNGVVEAQDDIIKRLSRCPIVSTGQINIENPKQNADS